MTHPTAHPGAQPSFPQKYRPSWAWFLVGGGLILIGGVAAVVIFVLTLSAFFTTDATVPADGQPHAVTVGTDGDRMLWRDEHVFDSGCTIVDRATGEQIELRTVTSQITKDFGDGEWRAAARFDPGSGDLEVTCSEWSDFAGTGQEVQIGPAPSAGSIVGGMIATFAVGGLLGLFGLATLIVTGVLWATRPARPKS